MATAAGVNADREDTDAWGRTPSVPLSRGLKIEDLASEIAADGQSDVSQLFSREALSHAVSGSIGGNIAMLGTPHLPLKGFVPSGILANVGC
jgi:hypothetical protein